MWLDKLESMNVKRRIDNCSVSISRHYYHVGGYVAEHTPFFIGQRLLAHTDGISSRYDSIANTIHSQRLKRPLMWAIVHTLAKNGVRSATHRTA